MTTAQPPLSYRDAGVDIDAGDALVEAIKSECASTHRPGVLGGLGGFGALFEIPPGRYREPVLVSGTDGVGTKLKLAIETGRHDTIGIDLVAMCVNDVIVQGAEPLFFLDYYATGKLDVHVARDVIKGIAAGCRQAGCALIGGETAEMPGMYAPKDYDLAGFCVGVAEKSRLLDGTQARAGDVVLGLDSSGPHSNGYSLIRKILEVSKTPLDSPFENGTPGHMTLDQVTLAQALLAPTRIYVKPLLALAAELEVHGYAHITGGGLPGNVPRVLTHGLRAVIEERLLPHPVLFDWLAREGHVARDEMLRTFNCGVGMVVIMPAALANQAIRHLAANGETARIIGHIETHTGEAEAVIA